LIILLVLAAAAAVAVATLTLAAAAVLVAFKPLLAGLLPFKPTPSPLVAAELRIVTALILSLSQRHL
jgi:hypothetical protein